MKENKKTIVIATGGTGGHIFPSVSLSSFLSDEYHVEFITDERGLKYLGSQKNLKVNVASSSRIFSKNVFKIFMNLINTEGCTPGSNGDCVGYQQDVYVSRSSSFVLIDGRENQMILAECALKPSTGSSDAYSGDLTTALTHINNVRTFHSLTELTTQDATDFDNSESGASTERTTLSETHPDPVNITGPKGLLIVERDKTCWLRGVRHYDQRRWGLWHWATDGSYWQYQPIPDSEIIQNPNLDRN